LVNNKESLMSLVPGYGHTTLVSQDHRTGGFDPNGRQSVFRFMNGYGASVVCHRTSYGGNLGKLELAVIRFTGQGDDEFELCYDTPVTSDVIGHLSRDQARSILEQIAALPPDARALPGAMLEE
jgi:hypothetical protein